jgi:hypothetical protein
MRGTATCPHKHIQAVMRDLITTRFVTMLTADDKVRGSMKFDVEHTAGGTCPKGIARMQFSALKSFP